MRALDTSTSRCCMLSIASEDPSLRAGWEENVVMSNTPTSFILIGNLNPESGRPKCGGL